MSIGKLTTIIPYFYGNYEQNFKGFGLFSMSFLYYREYLVEVYADCDGEEYPPILAPVVHICRKPPELVRWFGANEYIRKCNI